MENVILKDSGVNYNVADHTYTLNGKQLIGVTKMIHYQITPDKYANIPKATLDAAAAKGAAIHDACEEYDNFGTESSDYHVQDYIRLTRPFKYELSEYIVTDFENIASPIDKVFRVSADTFDIADIKTTSQLDIVSVTWQCSIYAYFFEQMNPTAKVRKLFAIWLPDERYQRGNTKPKIVTLNRIPDAEVKRLIFCEVNNLKYQENSIPRSERGQENTKAVIKTDVTLPAEIADMLNYIVETTAQFKKAEDAKTAMVEKLKDAMRQCNIAKFSIFATEETSGVSVSLSKDSTRKTFDAKRFAADHPDIKLDNYYNVSVTSGSLTIKLT